MTKLLVDTNNLSYCISKEFPGRKLDFTKYIEAVGEKFGAVNEKIAYVSRYNDDTEAFIKYLEECGFVIVSKAPRKYRAKGTVYWQTLWLVEMTIFSVANDPNQEKIVIGSSEMDLMPLYKEFPMSFGLYACGASRIFRDYCDVVEITEDLLV